MSGSKKTDTRAKGLQAFTDVYGEVVPASSLPSAGADRFTDFMLETVFAEVWANDTLDVRERRLILFGVIAAQGERDLFRLQTQAALANRELSPAQIEEALTMLSQYVGYPRASAMRAAVKDLL